MNTWAIFDTKNEKGGGGSVKRDPRSCCQKKWTQKDKRGIIYHRKEILKNRKFISWKKYTFPVPEISAWCILLKYLISQGFRAKFPMSRDQYNGEHMAIDQKYAVKSDLQKQSMRP